MKRLLDAKTVGKPKILEPFCEIWTIKSRPQSTSSKLRDAAELGVRGVLKVRHQNSGTSLRDACGPPKGRHGNFRENFSKFWEISGRVGRAGPAGHAEFHCVAEISGKFWGNFRKFSNLKNRLFGAMCAAIWPVLLRRGKFRKIRALSDFDQNWKKLSLSSQNWPELKKDLFWPKLKKFKPASSKFFA